MLDWVLGNKGKRKRKRKAGAGKPPPYDKAKEIAAEGSVKARRELASNEDLVPELLYYFASDKVPEVRLEVAQNVGTPLQADVVLARDVDDEVRCELARKIGRLIPTLTEDEKDRVTEMAIEVLEVLARDQLPRVRAIVSEEIKTATVVPHHIVKRLAEDVEEIVAAPVIEYSPLLSGEDLLEIVARGVGEGVLVALSRREDLIETVVDAVVAINSMRAMKAILENQGARISDETLEVIAVVASGKAELHGPMVDRKNLPVKILRRIASFVGASLMDTLIEHYDLDESLSRELRRAVRRRIDTSDFDDDEEPEREPAEDRAKKMFAQGSLDNETLIEAMEKNDIAFVRHALSLSAKLSLSLVVKMLDSSSGKAVAALSWKAGFDADTAEALQRRVAHLPSKSMVKSAGGGRYGMSDDELRWYVDYFGG